MNHQHGERGEGVTADDDEVDAARPDKGHQHSRHPRCDDPVQIHPRSIQRNGIRQLVLAHQLWDQALPTRHVECKDRPSQNRRHYHVPDLHEVGDDKNRDQKGDYGVTGLGDHQKVPLREPVADDSTEQGKEQKGRPAAGSHDAQVQRRAIQLVHHQPAPRQHLHLHPGEGPQHPQPQPSIAALLQGVEGVNPSQQASSISAADALVRRRGEGLLGR